MGQREKRDLEELHSMKGASGVCWVGHSSNAQELGAGSEGGHYPSETERNLSQQNIII